MSWVQSKEDGKTKVGLRVNKSQGLLHWTLCASLTIVFGFSPQLREKLQHPQNVMHVS